MSNLPPFWIAGIGLLLVLVFMEEFPRAGAALLGLIVLGLLLQYSRNTAGNRFGGSAPGTEF